MSFGRDVADLYDWWLDELSVIARAPRTSKRRADHQLIVGRESLWLKPRDTEDRLEVPLKDPSPVLTEHLRQGQRRPSVELCLLPERCLERRLASFRLPRRRARAMALLDVQSAT